MSSTLTK